MCRSLGADLVKGVVKILEPKLVGDSMVTVGALQAAIRTSLIRSAADSMVCPGISEYNDYCEKREKLLE